MFKNTFSVFVHDMKKKIFSFVPAYYFIFKTKIVSKPITAPESRILHKKQMFQSEQLTV